MEAEKMTRSNNKRKKKKFRFSLKNLLLWLNFIALQFEFNINCFMVEFMRIRFEFEVSKSILAYSPIPNDKPNTKKPIFFFISL